MARILTIIIFTGIAFNVCGQPQLKNCLYIGDKDKYVLSESIGFKDDHGNVSNQIFNSLFIWQKDKVVRIVFKYVKRMPGHVLANQQQLFSRFIPPFKKYTLHEKYSKIQIVGGEQIYRGDIVYSNKNENNSDNYTDLLKVVINNWNKKHNPMADMHASIDVSDGYPYLLSRNKKRKAEYANNLPLLFASGDSSYLIKPYIINVYRLEKSSGAIAEIKSGICYKLYSTISMMEGSFPDSFPEGKSYSVFNFETFINQNTLPQLYKIQLPLNSDSLAKSLATFPLADFKKYAFRENFKEIKETPIAGAETIKRVKRNDSIRAAHTDSLRKIYESNCFGHYQYCPECYNSKVPKAERIKMHCPVKIAQGGNGFDENWSYAFSAKGMNYFKVETMPQINSLEPYDSETMDVTKTHYPVKWLLMSPGIGYWMEDVAKNTLEYFMPEKSKTALLLDGKPIY